MYKKHFLQQYIFKNIYIVYIYYVSNILFTGNVNYISFLIKKIKTKLIDILTYYIVYSLPMNMYKPVNLHITSININK